MPAGDGGLNDTLRFGPHLGAKMKQPTNKLPFNGTTGYPPGTPIVPVMGTTTFGGSMGFFYDIKEKFFGSLVDLAKEYLAKHNQPDNIVNPLQQDELIGEVVTVRSDS